MDTTRLTVLYPVYRDGFVTTPITVFIVTMVMLQFLKTLYTVIIAK